MDSKIIKILEDDIAELGDSIIHERSTQELKPFINKEESDYRQYKKLIDTFITNFRTYLKFKEVKYDNQICLRFVKWCEEEIGIVHRLMKESKDNYGYDQYRCLNYVYTKLLDELNSYNLRKPIRINNDIIIEVGDRTSSEVLNDISSAWSKLNKDGKGKITKIIMER